MDKDNKNENVDNTDKKLHISDVISSLLIKAQKMYGNRYDKFSIQIRDNKLYVIGHETVDGEADWEHVVWNVDEAINYL